VTTVKSRAVAYAEPLGDLTFEAGFVLTAAIYLAWRLIADSRPAQQHFRQSSVS
jgi:hypothetical protein